MEKRILATVLAALLLLPCGGCGGEVVESAVSSEVESSVEPTATPEPTPTPTPAPTPAFTVTESDKDYCISLVNDALHEMGETENIVYLSDATPTPDGVYKMYFEIGERKLQATFYQKKDELKLLTVSRRRDEQNIIYYCTDNTLIGEYLDLTFASFYDYQLDQLVRSFSATTELDGNFVVYSPTPEPTATPEPTVTPTPTPAPTLSQQNAVKKAQSYLKYTAFSYSGLVKQLEYEQFSHEDAVYGVDHCGADWFEQAVEKAKDYLDYSSFSRGGLIDQLEYEGFTNEQAVYAVDTIGL